MINAKALVYAYDGADSPHRALDGISLTVGEGELVAVLGGSGSGKTTLARQLNALLPVQGGALQVAGFDAREEARVWQIRKSCGMVFQNPDDQFVSSYVEEELAFAPRNFGFPEEEVAVRVEAALAAVGMTGFARRSPQLLPAAQKLRIAIAGVLAADPSILLFDDVTALLDPEARRDALSCIGQLHAAGKTVVLFTSRAEEAVTADRVVLLHAGKKLAEGTPREILTDPALLQTAGLTPPFAVRVYHDLLEAGVQLAQYPLTLNELVDEICR